MRAIYNFFLAHSLIWLQIDLKSLNLALEPNRVMWLAIFPVIGMHAVPEDRPALLLSGSKTSIYFVYGSTQNAAGRSFSPFMARNISFGSYNLMFALVTR